MDSIVILNDNYILNKYKLGLYKVIIEVIDLFNNKIIYIYNVWV